jgi:hypothetical protein
VLEQRDENFWIDTPFTREFYSEGHNLFTERVDSLLNLLPSFLYVEAVLNLDRAVTDIPTGRNATTIHGNGIDSYRAK